LLKLLNKHKVRYVIVGAYAVAFYARPRYTKDMDILVEPEIENGRRVVAALCEFGFGELGLKEEDFSKEGRVVQLGYEPVRIDLITSIDGCTFLEVWKKKEVGRYGEEPIFFIGINELIKNKERTNRKQDETDLEILLKVKDK